MWVPNSPVDGGDAARLERLHEELSRRIVQWWQDHHLWASHRCGVLSDEAGGCQRSGAGGKAGAHGGPAREPAISEQFGHGIETVRIHGVLPGKWLETSPAGSAHASVTINIRLEWQEDSVWGNGPDNQASARCSAGVITGT